jgi:hypothetical protein
MTREELKEIENIDRETHLLTEYDLNNKEDRILISGYTCARDTFITELEDGEIRSYTIDFHSKQRIYRSIEYNSDYVPTKRVYPHKSDYEFCKLLRRQGVSISFTTFS